MGRRSQVLTVDCVACGVEIDARYRHSHKHGHKCQREDIKWDDDPDPSWSSEFIAWSGTCEACGRRVYECYVPEDALFDVASNKEI